MNAFITSNALAPTFTGVTVANRRIGFVLLAIFGSVLLAISAKVQVPFGLVNGTMQTLALFTIATAFGMHLAVATVALYLLEGTLGLPVFSGATGLAGPTGGYLAGFLIAAMIVGFAADRGLDKHSVKLFAAMLIAEIVILALGWAWLSSFIGSEKAWAVGVAPFLLADLVKIALAASIVPALWVWLRKLRG